ncbi:MAG: sterol desaturase family protein [Sphingorhabdus sp.]
MADGASPLGIWGIAIPAALFAVIAIIEWLRPRRAKTSDRKHRWPTHAGLFIANMITGRLLAFLVVVPAAANWAAENGFGLFNHTDWPAWLEILLAFIVLDFAVWLQHIALHKVPLLWRMHKVHHSDRHLDLTSALRFHPAEIIVSTLYKSAWVALLGVPALVALAFELWLNGNAMFNHSDIRLPPWLDRIIRPFLVTPDMHLVHHSTDRTEQDTNFGFALTLWDRLFRLYTYESRMGKDEQRVGIEEAQDERTAKLGWSLLLPFRNVS